MANGTGFRAFQKSLKPYLIAKGWFSALGIDDSKAQSRRLKTIFHTNARTAFAAGRWARIQENKALLPFLKYIGSTARDKRDAHNHDHLTAMRQLYQEKLQRWQNIENK